MKIMKQSKELYSERASAWRASRPSGPAAQRGRSFMVAKEGSQT